MGYMPGLVSATFRALEPKTVVEYALRAGLLGIEWGGDVHAPPEDLKKARKVGKLTCDHGLSVAAYGSYYHLGDETDERMPVLGRVLRAAQALGAPSVRVWAGRAGSEMADASYWRTVRAALERASALAADMGIRLDLEYHNNTLNDRPDAARRLLTDTSNVGTYWQPLDELNPEATRASLAAVLPWLTNLHVYADQGARQLLSSRAREWRSFLQNIGDSGDIFGSQQNKALPGSSDSPRFAMIEFVQQGAFWSLQQDAAALRMLLS